MLRATKHLSAADPVLGAHIKRVGRYRAEAEKTEPYQALVRSIAFQQLHGTAARAILGRFTALFPDQDFPRPEQVLSLSDASMRACGFSASKTLAIRDIAAKAAGRWTVEMMLMGTLGRLDILPVDDFGVREGYRVLNGLDAQPKPRELAAIGEMWAPYRSVAAWYLWRAADLAKIKA